MTKDPRSRDLVLHSPGDRVIVAPALSTDDARQRFENVEEVRPYLRWAKQPQT